MRNRLDVSRCCCCQPCVILKDDFNRTEIGSDWTVVSGNWSVASQVLNTDSGSATILTTAEAPGDNNYASVTALGADYGDELRLILAYHNSDNYVYLSLKLASEQGGCGTVAIYQQTDGGAVNLTGNRSIAGAEPGHQHLLELSVCGPTYPGTQWSIRGTVRTMLGSWARVSVEVLSEAGETLGRRAGLSTASITTLATFDNFQWHEHALESDLRCGDFDDSCRTLHDTFQRTDSDDPGPQYTEITGDWDISNNRLVTTGTGDPNVLSFSQSDTKRRSIEVVAHGPTAGKRVELWLGYFHVQGGNPTLRPHVYAELTFGEPGTLAIKRRDMSQDTTLATTTVTAPVDTDVTIRFCHTGTHLIAWAQAEGQDAVTINTDDASVPMGDSAIRTSDTAISFSSLSLWEQDYCTDCYGLAEHCGIASADTWETVCADWTKTGNWWFESFPILSYATDTSGARWYSTAGYRIPDGAVFRGSVGGAAEGDQALLIFDWIDSDNYLACKVTIGAADDCGTAEIIKVTGGSETTLQTAHSFRGFVPGAIVIYKACLAEDRIHVMFEVGAGAYLSKMQIGADYTTPLEINYGVGAASVAQAVYVSPPGLSHHKGPDHTACDSCHDCEILFLPSPCEWSGTGEVDRHEPGGYLDGTLVGGFHFGYQSGTATIQAGGDYVTVEHNYGSSARWNFNGTWRHCDYNPLGGYGLEFSYGRPLAHAAVGSWFGTARAAETSLGGATNWTHSGDGTFSVTRWDGHNCGIGWACDPTDPECQGPPYYRVVITGFVNGGYTQCSCTGINGSWLMYYCGQNTDWPWPPESSCNWCYPTLIHEGVCSNPFFGGTVTTSLSLGMGRRGWVAWVHSVWRWDGGYGYSHMHSFTLLSGTPGYPDPCHNFTRIELPLTSIWNEWDPTNDMKICDGSQARLFIERV